MVMKAVFQITMILLVLGLYVYLHEQAHLQVLAGHGCVKSEQGWSKEAIWVDCVEWSHDDQNVMLQEAKLQALTEIIGYHLFPFLVVAVLALFKGRN